VKENCNGCADKSSELIWETASKYYSDYHNVAKDFSIPVKEGLDIQKNFERLKIIEKDLKINFQQFGNKKILEIGCGVGSFLLAARTYNLTCYGIEPNDLGLLTCIKRDPLLKDNVFLGAGESLPFKNQSFDLVVSFQVIEHTQNPVMVLKESVRVLKPQGYLYFVIPNYNSFWEGHYGIFWLPQLPKRLGRIYLKFLKRDGKFLDSIQYITPGLIEEALLTEDVKILTYGKEKFLYRLSTLEFSTPAATKKLQIPVKIIKKLRISKFVGNLLCKLNMHYPLILVLQKNESPDTEDDKKSDLDNVVTET